MDPKVIDTLRYVAICAVFLFLGIFAFKMFKKMDVRKKAVASIREDISDTSFYHALQEQDAKATFLRCIAKLEKAHKLGIEPREYWDLVFEHKKENDLTSDSSGGEYTIQQKLIDNTVTTGWRNATQMHLFDETDAVETLLNGELPSMHPQPVIEYVINPTLSPGLEKVVPNLQLLPQAKKPGDPVTDMEATSTLQLVSDLCDANVIDRSAEKRIKDEFNAARQK